ncbi:MAG: histone H1-like repetitive region-containing protein, partial [Micromonosporaceae bacterium]|nr:histone H1-like repetitive region-containing protein [Micromonosporaceae bacterium]
MHAMAQEAWRAYLELALGMTEASRKKAKKTVKELMGKSPITPEQLQAMAEDLVTMGLGNREAITRMIRAELDRALLRVGLASGEEITRLETRIRELEEQLAKYVKSEQGPEEQERGQERGAASKTVARKAVAKKAVAKKAAAKKAAPEQVEAKTTAATTTAAKRPAAKRPAAKKAVAKKAVATKGAAKKAAGNVAGQLE